MAIFAFFIAAGTFSILGAVKNWDFFMNHRKARRLVAVLGRTGARWFYGVLGTALVVAGIVMAAASAFAPSFFAR
ncbi:MAG: immunity 17 family protein [Deltaproteobacteria bacterium]|nr:immunity 17 family protein [Deltaproteobacteria bacterium]